MATAFVVFLDIGTSLFSILSLKAVNTFSAGDQQAGRFADQVQRSEKGSESREGRSVGGCQSISREEREGRARERLSCLQA